MPGRVPQDHAPASMPRGGCGARPRTQAPTDGTCSCCAAASCTRTVSSTCWATWWDCSPACSLSVANWAAMWAAASWGGAADRGGPGASPSLAQLPAGAALLTVASSAAHASPGWLSCPGDCSSGPGMGPGMDSAPTALCVTDICCVTVRSRPPGRAAVKAPARCSNIISARCRATATPAPVTGTIRVCAIIGTRYELASSVRQP